MYRQSKADARAYSKQFRREHPEEMHRIDRLHEKRRAKKLKAMGLTKWDTLKPESKAKIQERNEEYHRIGMGNDVNSHKPYTKTEDRIVLTGKHKGKNLLGKDIALLLGRTYSSVANRKLRLMKEA